MIKINYEAYNDPFIVNLHKDINTGKPITIEIINELQKVIDGKITLNEIPDEFRKVAIKDMEEVERVILHKNQYKVDYTYGLVQFHPDVEDGTTITILKYYGRGVALIPDSRIYMTSSDGFDETLNDYISSIMSYVYKGDYNNSISYNKNEMVYFDGSTYINITGCQGVLPINTSYWREMASGFVFKGDYNTSTTYYKNEIVSKDNIHLYMSLQQSINTPVTNTQYWTKIISVESFKQSFDIMVEQGNRKVIELTNASNEYNNTLKPDILDKTSKANIATSNCIVATDECIVALDNYEQNLLLSIKIFKEPVQTFDDIATTYPNPQNGWTVKVSDDGNTYRYDGVILNDWQLIDNTNIDVEISIVDGKIGSLNDLQTIDKTNIVKAVNEVNAKITNEISKIHIHDNKYVLDLLSDIDGNLQYNGKLIVTDIDGGTF